MRSKDGKYTGVVGEVLDFQPPFVYATTFKFTNFDDLIYQVTHELNEVADGIEYQMISAEIPIGTKTEQHIKQGGTYIISTLKGVIENGKPPFSSRLILTMISLLAWTSPEICLSENWPLDKKIQSRTYSTACLSASTKKNCISVRSLFALPRKSFRASREKSPELELGIQTALASHAPYFLVEPATMILRPQNAYAAGQWTDLDFPHQIVLL